MDCKEINNRINSELCEDIISKLSDISLLETYKKQKSVKNKINKLKDILINPMYNKMYYLLLILHIFLMKTFVLILLI